MPDDFPPGKLRWPKNLETLQTTKPRYTQHILSTWRLKATSLWKGSWDNKKLKTNVNLAKELLLFSLLLFNANSAIFQNQYMPQLFL